MARLVMDLDAFLDYPWGRVAFKNLILSIKEKDFNKQSYTLDGFVEPLQIWVYEAMPDFAKLIGEPFPGNPSPPLLAYRGSRGRKNVKENILKQTNFRHYKTIGGMISPVWQDDESDDKIDNILRAFNGDFGPWKWGRGLWETVGIYQSNNPKVKIEEKGSSKRAGEFDEPSGKRHCPGHSTDMGDIGVNILESLKDELGMWGGALLDQMREGFNSCDLRFDMLTEKIEGLASDLDKMKGDVTGTKQADPVAKGKKDSPASAGTEEDASNEQKKDVAITGTKEAVSKEKNDSKSDMVSSEHLQFPTTIPHKHNTRYKAKKKLDFQKDSTSKE